VQSVTTQDLPVIVGIVLLAELFIVLANVVVDAVYAVLIRASGSAECPGERLT